MTVVMPWELWWRSLLRSCSVLNIKSSMHLGPKVPTYEPVWAAPGTLGLGLRVGINDRVYKYVDPSGMQSTARKHHMK